MSQKPRARDDHVSAGGRLREGDDVEQLTMQERTYGTCQPSDDGAARRRHSPTSVHSLITVC